MQADKKALLVTVYNHLDPMHRRCFDREFTYKGDTFIPYADLEEYYILENLEIARKRPDYKFVIETVLVARKFLERRPELAGELKQLAAESRMCVSGCGDNIIDANMVLGESLVRNFLTGLLWVEDTFGQKTGLGNRFDAFGNSAQLPQILRGCGMKWCTGLLYTRMHGRYWRGLDGSTVFTGNLPSVGEGGHYRVYGPCPVCRGDKKLKGQTCGSCTGLGIDRHDGDKDWVFSDIDEEAFGEFKAGLVRLGGEELLPHPQSIAWVDALKERYDARFALPEESAAYLAHWLDRVDDPDEQDVSAQVELNPNNTGCYVTRIKTKQNCRRQEYALMAAEALSVMACLKGSIYPSQEILAAWQRLFFTMFHDAITGTHVDPAYEELQDVWRRIDGLTDGVRRKALERLVEKDDRTVTVINPTGSPVTCVAAVSVPGNADTLSLEAEGGEARLLELRQHGDRVDAKVLVDGVGPYSAVTLRISDNGMNTPEPVELELPVIENGRYRVTADDHGLLAVYDKRLGRNILAVGEYRPGEFILEHDEGSPWATLSADMERTKLSELTRLVSKQQGPGYQRLAFEIPVMHSYAEDAVGIRYDVTLWEGIDRVDFYARVYWEDFNHRLRVAMPAPFGGRHVYEIPYGQLSREPYEPQFETRKLFQRWSDPTGDWPAVNWAGVDGPGASVALMNKGTPSYRIEKGESGDVMLLSVLRSPCVPTYLHEPRACTMTDWVGIRDAGVHEFEYAVMSCRCSLAESGVVNDAESYNAGLLAVTGKASLPEMPTLLSHNVRIASVKHAEKGDALILRLAEYRGNPGDAEVKLPGYVKNASMVNLLEREGMPLEVRNGSVRLELRAFEIATLRLEL